MRTLSEYVKIETESGDREALRLMFEELWDISDAEADTWLAQELNTDASDVLLIGILTIFNRSHQGAELIAYLMGATHELKLPDSYLKFRDAAHARIQARSSKEHADEMVGGFGTLV